MNRPLRCLLRASDPVTSSRRRAALIRLQHRAGQWWQTYRGVLLYSLVCLGILLLLLGADQRQAQFAARLRRLESRRPVHVDLTIHAPSTRQAEESARAVLPVLAGTEGMR